MMIINTNPNHNIQIGYEGEDKVTILRFSYSDKWLENGDGIFTIRVLRNGENQAYNAQLIEDDRENYNIDMTVTDVELSKKGYGEMQLVYTGADFVKKSPVYKYYVSRSVDEAVNPPDGDVYTQIIESLSDLQMDVRGLTDVVEDIGDISLLTTTAKTDLVSAINEVNAKGGTDITVDERISPTSTNPVQNRAISAQLASVGVAIGRKADTATVSALADAIHGLDGDVQGLQTAVQGKADTSTVTALSNRVTSVETDKASHDEVDTVQDNLNLLGQVAQQYMEQTSATLSGLQTAMQSKADKTTATASADGLMSSADKSKLDAVYSDYTSALTAIGGGS